jgi:hypothetical protein
MKGHAMSGMMNFSTRVAALGIAGLVAAGTVAPAVAQTYVVPEQSYVHSWNAPVYGGYAYSGRVMPQWNSPFSGTECWTDEGYGRRTQCDASYNGQ